MSGSTSHVDWGCGSRTVLVEVGSRRFPAIECSVPGGIRERVYSVHYTCRYRGHLAWACVNGAAPYKRQRPSPALVSRLWLGGAIME